MPRIDETELLEPLSTRTDTGSKCPRCTPLKLAAAAAAFVGLVVVVVVVAINHRTKPGGNDGSGNTGPQPDDGCGALTNASAAVGSFTLLVVGSKETEAERVFLEQSPVAGAYTASAQCRCDGAPVYAGPPSLGSGKVNESATTTYLYRRKASGELLHCESQWVIGHMCCGPECEACCDPEEESVLLENMGGVSCTSNPASAGCVGQWLIKGDANHVSETFRVVPAQTTAGCGAETHTDKLPEVFVFHGVLNKGGVGLEDFFGTYRLSETSCAGAPAYVLPNAFHGDSEYDGYLYRRPTPHMCSFHWAIGYFPLAESTSQPEICDPEGTGILFRAGYDTEGVKGGVCPETPSALGCSGKWSQINSAGDISNPTLSVSADGIPTASICSTKCPKCKTNPHHNSQPKECTDCASDGQCWPGHNLSDTTDHTCDCLATLGYCEEGVEPVLKPGDTCPSCWPVDNVACACFGALPFCGN